MSNVYSIYVTSPDELKSVTDNFLVKCLINLISLVINIFYCLFWLYRLGFWEGSVKECD